MLKTKEHWANKVEHTSVLGIKFLFSLYKLFGRLPFRFALAPVVFCIWLTDSKARSASLDYLKRSQKAGYLQKKPSGFTTLHHVYYFAETILDKMLAVWSPDYVENLTIDNEDIIKKLLQSNKGAVVLTSHMGCVEALMHHGSLNKMPIIALVHSANTARFTNLVENSHSLKQIEFWEVTDLNPASIMSLEEKCSQGYMIFIAGDRIPMHSESVAHIKLLQSFAFLPTGGVLLAHMLRLPLLSMTCWREKGAAFSDVKGCNQYHVRFATLANEVRLSRKNRQQDCNELMQKYAKELELAMKNSPFDWFNFYQFWN